ncbi:WXG100 family type VII secretion target [Mycobacterium xenopi]|uniref:WXG100 family type VII secretion target n=1 Tax=Mycobacterium xenopi TaxID=1789 RepID=UPI000A149649|nr:WXG100 family type VII secretion target [Mycobacterium xenopi]ORX14149.1 type VII secretion protein EsxH [Mycobacterium xenopi]SPX94845.1 WXG100 family type VII secretion target [Mycobacterium xenopi]
MGQILYNYPAMLGHVGEMTGYGAAIRSVGSAISSEQGALAAGWVGDTGMTYQSWQTQWNTALDELINAYHQMTSAHENNTTSMLARDQAEGAKWGG